MFHQLGGWCENLQAPTQSVGFLEPRRNHFCALLSFVRNLLRWNPAENPLLPDISHGGFLALGAFNLGNAHALQSCKVGLCGQFSVPFYRLFVSLQLSFTLFKMKAR